MSPRALLLPLFLAALLAGCSADDDALATTAYGGEPGRYEAPPADTAATVTRRVWADSAGLEAALVSPTLDGREIVLTDWRTGDLAVLGIGTGDMRHITRNEAPYAPGFAMLPRISRDGRRVAYGWWDAEKPDLWEVRIIDLAGGEPRVVHAGPTTVWAQVEDWSPDGRWILASRTDSDAARIVLIAVDGGEERVLRTTDWRLPTRMGFSPDGRWVAYDAADDENRAERDVFVMSVEENREIRLIDHLADDRFLGWTPDGRHILVASDRTGTPAAWLFPVADGRVDGQPLLVKPDLWQVRGVGFTPDSRFWYAVETGTRSVRHVHLDPATGRPLGEPVEMRAGAAGSSRSAAWSADGRHLAYLGDATRPMPGASTTIIVRSLETGESRQFGLPPRIWQAGMLAWHPDGRSLLFRAQARSTPPSIFRLDMQTGEVTDFFRPKGGDQPLWMYDWQLSGDGGTLMYLVESSRPEGGAPGETERSLVLREVASGVERVIHRRRVPVNGVQLRDPVLSPDGQTVGFVYWQVADGRGSPLMVVSAAGGDPRVVTSDHAISDVVFDADGSHLLFTAATSDDPEAPVALHRVSVDGGEVESLGLDLVRFDELELHPGTGRLAFTAGNPETELWLMEGFIPNSPRR